jgi:glyoxylase-like metal-dependent hydrolase (beta-lactamase superfamily II)
VIRASHRVLGALLGSALFAALDAGAQPPAAVNPMIKQDARVKLSEHAYVILDNDVNFVPNVGLVVGERATLIIDTGIGEANGAIVLQEARKIRDNSEFYVAATHFHPEHDLGATAFPANAKMLRWRTQQLDVDELGADMSQRFSGFSPVLKDLLATARFRPADVIFDAGITIDLGGVHVRIFGVGPTHTRGDTVFFVEEDRVLYTGDVVMSVFPAVSGQTSSIAQWLADLDEFEKLNPAVVVPAHGRTGDVGFVRRYRDYFAAVQREVAKARRAGTAIDAATAQLAPSLAAQFPDLAPLGGPATGRINAAIEAAYCEAAAP